MKKARIITALVLITGVCLFTPELSAKVIVNEVMANEPGGSTSLEWIELYVDSAESVSMDSYGIIVGDKLITFPPDLILDPDEYYIICRKLTATDNTPSFEGRWGDSSGYWGDTPEEAALQTPHEAVFSLTNAAGSVGLYRNLSLISELTWTQGGQDGFSWERTSPKSDYVNQSVDSDGSTPGEVNSLTPVDYDLALEAVSIVSEEVTTNITFALANRGINRVVGAQLFLYIGDEVTPLEIINLPNLGAGDIDSVIGHYSLNGLYVNMKAVLSEDDRIGNNSQSFVAPGIDFPPLILTEMLANPQPGSTTEWIEIRNRLNQSWDLSGWKVGDSRTVHSVTDTSIILEPYERAVLVCNRFDFENYYFAFAGRLIQPLGWSQLNNSGDTVRLVDQYELEADRFEYDSTFESNHTWSRGEKNPFENEWGRSEQPDGSPGEVNRVVFRSAATTVSIELSPSVFSPDDDGIEDSTVIMLTAPDQKNIELKIYDRQGRIVYEFDIGAYHDDSYVWYGRSDSGNRLPIGIYIVYCNVEGVGTVKKPVVIAR